MMKIIKINLDYFNAWYDHIDKELYDLKNILYEVHIGKQRIEGAITISEHIRNDFIKSFQKLVKENEIVDLLKMDPGNLVPVQDRSLNQDRVIMALTDWLIKETNK